MPFQEPQKLPFLFDALYCEEEGEHWGQADRDPSCSIEEQEEEEEESVVLLEQDLLWEDGELSSLLSKEQENELFNVVQKNPDLAKARSEAVEWVLKVTSHYSFSAQTALLAVNYLDRLFFLSLESQTQKPWMSQLAAVACLSLAAKVEETFVPLLLDFQVEESEYVFEAKTIQRMELLVLSNLEWKMNPVTPFSFLDYIARRLELKSHLCCEFLRRCEGVLLSIISDCRFMCYLPSVMASATMLHVISRLVPTVGEESQEQLMGILGIDKVKVEECQKLIKEVASRIQFESAYKRKYGAMPGSPKGVMEVSFSSSSSSLSSDSSKDSWAVSANASSSSSTSATSSVSSSPEPLSKKTRMMSPQEHQNSPTITPQHIINH
ncbi:PREDICTED: cyclin-D3-3-like [Ipomoea nil]|uniref:cyclin-D3-3-like n=1 Tax=Ipomoea nil TaxID=35883 RepID=UPI0009015911|nr:PREDICTED: cyclin-D3-3-like [Ipomoea nil]